MEPKYSLPGSLPPYQQPGDVEAAPPATATSPRHHAFFRCALVVGLLLSTGVISVLVALELPHLFSSAGDDVSSSSSDSLIAKRWHLHHFGLNCDRDPSVCEWCRTGEIPEGKDPAYYTKFECHFWNWDRKRDVRATIEAPAADVSPSPSEAVVSKRWSIPFGGGCDDNPVLCKYCRTGYLPEKNAGSGFYAKFMCHLIDYDRKRDVLPTPEPPVEDVSSLVSDAVVTKRWHIGLFGDCDDHPELCEYCRANSYRDDNGDVHDKGLCHWINYSGKRDVPTPIEAPVEDVSSSTTSPKQKRDVQSPRTTASSTTPTWENGTAISTSTSIGRSITIEHSQPASHTSSVSYAGDGREPSTTAASTTPVWRLSRLPATGSPAAYRSILVHEEQPTPSSCTPGNCWMPLLGDGAVFIV